MNTLYRELSASSFLSLFSSLFVLTSIVNDIIICGFILKSKQFSSEAKGVVMSRSSLNSLLRFSMRSKGVAMFSPLNVPPTLPVFSFQCLPCTPTFPANNYFPHQVLSKTLHAHRFVTYAAQSAAVSSPSTSAHPSAIVHPSAVIGQDVSIGPFCTVGSNVKLGDGCQMHPNSHVCGDTELGERCVIMNGAIVGDDLPGSTVIGKNNHIGYNAVVGIRCQDLKYKMADECFLQIGDNNDIREFASIHRSAKSNDKTVIGDNNLIMGSCHIAHDCKVGDNNIFANGTLFGGHVVIEDFTHTSGGVVVHQFCQIGSHAFVGAGSVVLQDVPRYLLVSGDKGKADLCGLNSEGLRRHGFSNEEMRSLKIAYRKIFMPKDSTAGGIEDRLSGVEHDEELSKFDVVRLMLQSIRDSFKENRRGICKTRFEIIK